jgi:hypothetical protein
LQAAPSAGVISRFPDNLKIGMICGKKAGGRLLRLPMVVGCFHAFMSY